jgi:hypothetical protein
MTFKDLQRLAQQSETNEEEEEQTQLFEKLRSKPFWI